MSRNVVAILVLVALAGGATALVAIGGSHHSATSTTAAGQSIFTSSEQCKECHRQVWDEWKGSQHAFAYVNPLVRREDMADGFRKKDCIPCHAPRSVFEFGLGKSARVLQRDVNMADGVDCLSCHAIAGGVAATRAGLSGACIPTLRPELRTTDLCAPCHNQHNTVDEWEASAADLRGENCSGCHMPEVPRAAENGRPAYVGRSHASHGGKDMALLQSAPEVTWKIEDAATGPSLVVSVKNKGAAHNLPTDARHRALDLVITLTDAEGRLVGVEQNLGAGEQGGTARMRFRNPYREEYGKVNTEIPSGETRSVTVPFTRGAATDAEIRLIYKRTPLVLDAEGAVVFSSKVKL